MRATVPLAITSLLALSTVAPLVGQIISNPIPAAIEKRGLAVQIRDLVRLPDTRGLRPLEQDVSPSGWARVSFVRDLPDGRRFVNDSRGFLYLLDANNQTLFAVNAKQSMRTSTCPVSMVGSGDSRNAVRRRSFRSTTNSSVRLIGWRRDR